MDPRVSIIICTYNGGTLVERAVTALLGDPAFGDHIEVIIVDDGSTDDTLQRCRKLERSSGMIEVLHTRENRGTSEARNLGLRTARGELLLFLDHDCIPSLGWTANMISALSNESIVCGAIESPASPYLKLCHNIAQFHRFMPGRRSGREDFMVAANSGVRRSALAAIGGFAPGSICEDTEFIFRARKCGYNAFFTTAAVVTHDPPRQDFITILRYAAAHAAATIKLRIAYSEMLRTPVVLRSVPLLLLSAPLIALLSCLQAYRNRYARHYLRTLPVVYLLKLAWCWGAAQGLRELKNAQSRATSHAH